MDSVSLRYRKEGWMDEWISVSLRLDGWISVSLRVFVGCQMYVWYGWKDGWIDSVSLRYSFCGKSDGWIV